jgi:hypothetical protein
MARRLSSGGGYQQEVLPYRFTLSIASGSGEILFEMMLPWNGTTPISSATLRLPPGAPHGTETICASAGTLSHVDRNGATGPNQGSRSNFLFTLEMLSLGVGTTCPGTALAGRLDMCLAESN